MTPSLETRELCPSEAESAVWKLQTRKWLSAVPAAFEAPDEATIAVSQQAYSRAAQRPRLQVVEALHRLEKTTRSIGRKLDWADRYSEIQREWGQLARVVERLLMIVFVVGTALFALLVTVLAVPVPIVSYWSNS